MTQVFSRYALQYLLAELRQGAPLLLLMAACLLSIFQLVLSAQLVYFVCATIFIRRSWKTCRDENGHLLVWFGRVPSEWGFLETVALLVAVSTIFKFQDYAVLLLN